LTCAGEFLEDLSEQDGDLLRPTADFPGHLECGPRAEHRDLFFTNRISSSPLLHFLKLGDTYK
jgi:hypothetical protein